MWSNNKYINLTLNILLFLIGINFLHYGQLLLPVMCLILFLDNKCIFRVNNIKTFVLLCLFAISFCYFSYDLGFYCVMGFCLPMAYYVGSNLKECNEEKVKNIIYILALGMGCHLVLNFIYDFYLFGTYALYKVKHYDIWTQGYVVATSTATNYVLIISSIYYIVVYEKNKLLKTIGIVVFCICMAYDIVLGRRMPVVLLLIVLIISYIYDVFVLKNRRIDKKKIKVLVFILLVFVLFTLFNYSKLNEYLVNVNIIKKFRNFGLDTERLEIFIDGIKLAPKHLWGKQEISNILGIQIHDFWSDIYDYAGIISFVLIVIYTILFVKEVIVMIFNRKINPKLKTLFAIVFMAILLEMLIEPIMTGSSIFLISVIIIGAVIEKINVHQ